MATHLLGFGFSYGVATYMPPAVAAAVDFVAPTVHFPPAAQPAPKFETLSREALLEQLGVGAKKLRTLYSVNDVTGGAAGNRHAVTGFLKQHYHPKDLGEFWKLSMGGVNASQPTPKEVGDLVFGA